MNMAEASVSKVEGKAKVLLAQSEINLRSNWLMAGRASRSRGGALCHISRIPIAQLKSRDFSRERGCPLRAS